MFFQLDNIPKIQNEQLDIFFVLYLCYIFGVPCKTTKMAYSLEEGVNLFGAEFKKWDSMESLYSRLPAFKKYFIEKKKENPSESIRNIIKGFHELEVLEGRTFYMCPVNMAKRGVAWTNEAIGYIPPVVRPPRRAWDTNPVGVLSDPGIVTDPGVSSDAGVFIEPRVRSVSTLEQKVDTLADVLIDDAHEVLSDNENDESVGDMVNRKKYAVMVLGYVTKLVHGKKSLSLKEKEEKRNETSFLMDFLKKATAGNVSAEELDLLNSSKQ